MQVAQQPAVLGVTRSPWSITWDAHVASAAAGTDCGGANLGADTAGLSMKDADKVSRSGHMHCLEVSQDVVSSYLLGIYWPEHLLILCFQL